jgi:hypothetical protein
VTVETWNLVLDKEKAAEFAVDRAPATIVAAPGCDESALRRAAWP